MIDKFIGELKRRNVPRAALLYLGAVWALAQGIAQLGPELGAPDSATRWFVIAAGIGFPIWLIVSWRYELTSSGLKLDSEIAESVPKDRKSNRRVDLAIIGVLAIAVVLLLTDRLLDRADPTQGGPAVTLPAGNAIAVLPFDNLSSDKDQQYFSDGLSEGFIVALARIKDLRVINRKSSFEFRDSKEDSRAIAAKLGVTHLLEGSVRRVGDTVRIRASLTKAADGSTLWAANYDRPYKDLFALQDQITGQVANALKAQLQPAPTHSQHGDRPPSGNLEAYNAYLQARSATELGEATKLYDLSVQLEPNYGVAYSRKARMLLDTLSNGGLSGAQAGTAFEAADSAIQQALRLAPGQASTHIARGYLLMLRDFDWQGSEAEFKRAVELAPEDGEALFQLGVVRASQGDLVQAVELTRKALKLDPLNVIWNQWLVAYLMPLGRLDEAEQTVGHAIKLKPDLFFNHYLLTVIKVLRKDASGAKQDATAEPVGPWQDFALALAAQIGSDRAAADAILKDSIDKYASGWAFQIAQLYAVRGEPDLMFEWLGRAWKARDPGMQSLLYDALLLRYRNDPRYSALAKEVGLPSPPAAGPAPPAGPKPAVAAKP